MLSKSNGKLFSAKRPKPRPNWPFFWHASEAWAMKIPGRLVYVGTYDDTAIQRWETQRDEY